MKVIVAGFDGYGKSIVDSMLEKDKGFDIKFLDSDESHIGESFAGIEVSGTIDDMQNYYDKGYHSICIANERDLRWRKQVAEKAQQIGYKFFAVVDKSAQIGYDAVLGDGCYVAKGVVVDPAVTIGENVIINAGATIQSESKSVILFI